MQLREEVRNDDDLGFGPGVWSEWWPLCSVSEIKNASMFGQQLPRSMRAHYQHRHLPLNGGSPKSPSTAMSSSPFGSKCCRPSFGSGFSSSSSSSSTSCSKRKLFGKNKSAKQGAEGTGRNRTAATTATTSTSTAATTSTSTAATTSTTNAAAAAAAAGKQNWQYDDGEEAAALAISCRTWQYNTAAIESRSQSSSKYEENVFCDHVAEEPAVVEFCVSAFVSGCVVFSGAVYVGHASNLRLEVAMHADGEGLMGRWMDEVFDMYFDSGLPMLTPPSCDVNIVFFFRFMMFRTAEDAQEAAEALLEDYDYAFSPPARSRPTSSGDDFSDDPTALAASRQATSARGSANASTGASPDGVSPTPSGMELLQQSSESGFVAPPHVNVAAAADISPFDPSMSLVSAMFPASPSILAAESTLAVPLHSPWIRHRVDEIKSSVLEALDQAIFEVARPDLADVAVGGDRASGASSSFPSATSFSSAAAAAAAAGYGHGYGHGYGDQDDSYADGEFGASSPIAATMRLQVQQQEHTFSRMTPQAQEALHQVVAILESISYDDQLAIRRYLRL